MAAMLFLRKRELESSTPLVQKLIVTEEWQSAFAPRQRVTAILPSLREELEELEGLELFTMYFKERRMLVELTT